MIRAYRFAVTVYIEGDKATAPAIQEIAEHIATQVQDADDHDLATHVVPIETEDYQMGHGNHDTYPKTKATTTNPRPRRKRCGDEYPRGRDERPYRCQLPPNHEGKKHCDTRNPLHPEWE